MCARPVFHLKLYRGIWHITWLGEKGTRRASLHTKDRAQAERNFQEYLRQLKGESGDINATLDQWLHDKSYLKSLEDAKRKIPFIRDFFGNLWPDQVNKDLCREYAKFRGKSNTTIRNELAILRGAIRNNNPKTEAEFWFPNPDPPKSKHITREEYKTLVAAARSPHIRLFIILALGTGQRSNAILGLLWANVSLSRKIIDFTGENSGNKRRAIVPMTDTVYDALRTAYNYRTCEHVIEHASRGVKSIRKAFGRLAKEVGIDVTPHMLRHSAAVWMAEDRVPMEEIAQFLGHSTPNITYKVYARYSPDYLRRAAESLNV